MIFDKINAGCGKRLCEGWLNVDTKFRTPYGKIGKSSVYDVLHYDLTKKAPFENGSIRIIYASHFIEHLSLKEGTIFVTRCYNYLASEGIIRFAFPDLNIWIENYCNNNEEFFKKYKKLWKLDASIETKSDIFMSQVHGWNHKWAYDFESIKHLLTLAGFSNIERKQVYESEIDDIEIIEENSEGRIMETCYVEAKKCENNG